MTTTTTSGPELACQFEFEGDSISFFIGTKATGHFIVAHDSEGSPLKEMPLGVALAVQPLLSGHSTLKALHRITREFAAVVFTAFSRNPNFTRVDDPKEVPFPTAPTWLNLSRGVEAMFEYRTDG